MQLFTAPDLSVTITRDEAAKAFENFRYCLARTSDVQIPEPNDRHKYHLGLMMGSISHAWGQDPKKTLALYETSPYFRIIVAQAVESYFLFENLEEVDGH